MRRKGQWGAMKCSVAREALSARIDGEREPVPAARVDEHLEECADCARWYLLAARFTVPDDSVLPAPDPGLADRIMRTQPRPSAGDVRRRRLVVLGQWGLTAAGLVVVLLAVTQAAGLRFGMGMSHHGGMGDGRHLMNESTAIMFGLGIACVVAAWWRAALPGIVVVLVGYCACLLAYVLDDLVAGEVTAARAASHLPLLAAVVFAIMLWRSGSGGGDASDDLASPTNIGPVGHVSRRSDAA